MDNQENTTTATITTATTSSTTDNNASNTNATTPVSSASSSAAQNPASSAQPSKSGPVKLFVGMIPRTAEAADLMPIFAPFGPVVEIHIIRDRVTRQNRGCAFVLYERKEDAATAIASLNNRHIIPPNEAPIQVRYADGEAEKQEYKLFVGMLSRTADEDEVRRIFEPYGNITEVVILREGGMSRGCGFVKYTTREEALSAIAALDGKYRMNGSNHELAVRFADTDKSRRRQQQQQYQPQYDLSALGGYAQTLSQLSAGAGAIYAGTPAAATATAAATYDPLQPYATPAAAASQLAATPYSSYYGTQQALSALYATPDAMSGANLYNAVAQTLPQFSAQQAAQPVIQQQQQTRGQQGPPGANLFICFLPQHFTDADMMTTFSPFGHILSARVFIDKATGLSKCFGFVSYDNPMSAQMAISSMNGFQIGNKRLKVSLKTEKARPY